jgi:hypothetical protein
LRRFGIRDALLPVVMAASLLLALPGCPKRLGPPVPLDESDLPDPETIYQEILAHSDQVQTLQATADLRLQTGEEKASVDAVIACDREGRLRFEVLDWLNHVVFLALFDKKGFLTYSAHENQYREGPDDTAQTQEILGLPLRAEELVAMALGNPFFLSLTDPTIRLSLDQGSLILDAESSSSGPRYLVWLDERGRPERMFVIRSTLGKRAFGDLRVDYGRYRQIGSVSFPHRIRVAATGSQRVLQVDYQTVLLNEPLREDLFRFDPPQDAVKAME